MWLISHGHWRQNKMSRQVTVRHEWVRSSREDDAERPTGTDYQQTITDIHKANRFHVIKLISLHSVEFLPKATFRSLLRHHSYVLEHAADDLTAHTPRHVPCRWQNQLLVLQRYYYFTNLQSYHRLDLPLLLLQCVHEKRPPSIMSWYTKYLANISEIFTTEFSAYLYIVCKNSWKFKAKIIFYYMFSITCQKHQFPWQHRLHIHSYFQ